MMTKPEYEKMLIHKGEEKFFYVYQIQDREFPVRSKANPFVFDSSSQPRTTLYKTVHVPGQRFAVQLTIPVKKVVVDKGNLVEMEEAYTLYTDRFIDEHTLEIELEEKFDECHKQAFILLSEKIKVYEKMYMLLDD